MTEGPDLLTASFDDTGAFARAIPHAQMSCLQTSKGSIRLDFAMCSSPRLALQFTSLPVGSCVLIGTSAAGGHSFHVPLGDFQRVSFAGDRMDERSFVAYGPETEYAVCASDGASFAYVVPQKSLLEETFIAVLGRDPPAALLDGNIISTDASKAAQLRAFLQEVKLMITHAPHVCSNPEVFRSLKHATMSLLVRAYCVDNKPVSGPGRLPVSRCKTLRKIDRELERNVSQPVYVKDLCLAAGISQPTLYRVFFDALEMSPKRYLQLRRLHLVRSRLLHGTDPQRTVSSVAYDCGFWQLGRMGQAYRDLFGEAPQKTLQRSRKLGS